LGHFLTGAEAQNCPSLGTRNSTTEVDRPDARPTGEHGFGRGIEKDWFPALEDRGAAMVGFQMERQGAEGLHGPQVVVADDDPLVRIVLREAIQREGFVVVAECGTVRDAVSLTLSRRPDLLLVDWSLPDGDALEVIRKVSATDPRIPIVVLTASPDERAPLRSLIAGASGFLSKDAVMNGLGRTLRAVLDGEAAISRRLARSVVDRLQAFPANQIGTRPVRSRLSAREWEVFDLLCESRSTDEIADILVLSTETVRTHVKNILRKLDVRSRREAVELAPLLRKPQSS
jgi:DNA-binding NarL/FixJ family response regulator